ncbi:hypothetical protein KCV02_g23965, partial [Aureobasidium melanogenum]
MYTKTKARAQELEAEEREAAIRGEAPDGDEFDEEGRYEYSDDAMEREATEAIRGDDGISLRSDQEYRDDFDDDADDAQDLDKVIWADIAVDDPLDGRILQVLADRHVNLDRVAGSRSYSYPQETRIPDSVQPVPLALYIMSATMSSYVVDLMWQLTNCFNCFPSNPALKINGRSYKILRLLGEGGFS